MTWTASTGSDYWCATLAAVSSRCGEAPPSPAAQRQPSKSAGCAPVCGRRGMHGSTDKGSSCMHHFFETHSCCALCVLFRLRREMSRGCQQLADALVAPWPLSTKTATGGSLIAAATLLPPGLPRQYSGSGARELEGSPAGLRRHCYQIPSPPPSQNHNCYRIPSPNHSSSPYLCRGSIHKTPHFSQESAETAPSLIAG